MDLHTLKLFYFFGQNKATVKGVLGRGLKRGSAEVPAEVPSSIEGNA